jgi:hypothetical protein
MSDRDLREYFAAAFMGASIGIGDVAASRFSSGGLGIGHVIIGCLFASIFAVMQLKLRRST